MTVCSHSLTFSPPSTPLPGPHAGVGVEALHRADGLRTACGGSPSGVVYAYMLHIYHTCVCIYIYIEREREIHMDK